jgi:L-threonylcarbamoyladenylate synthase
MNRISINDPESLQKAVAVLRAGGVIVYPTDTAYGLGADATNADAVEKVFAIKNRSENPIPVIVADIEQAKNHVFFSTAGQKLAEAYWPGALTLVLTASDPALAHIIRAETTIGVRVPGIEWCRQVAHELGKPFTSTSANTAGSPAEYSLEGAYASLGENAALVDLWIDGGTLDGGPVSTVVLASEDPVMIKREGAVSGADIKKVLE